LNPKSGSSVDASSVRTVRDYLRDRHQPMRLQLTRSLEHAGDLAREAIAAGAAAVVVSGGDGTVRTVAEAMAGSEIPILVVPSGTENLLAQELGIDGSRKTSLKMLEEGTVRKLDLGRANDRYFMAIVGVGFDAQVVRRINQFRSGHITHSDYIWPICRTFWEYGFPHLRVEADGELICDEPSLVFVGNITRYAVGLPIHPYADCSNGVLDITIYRYRRRRELLLHSVRTVLRQAERSSQMSRHTCKEVTIRSPQADVPVQLDGDPGPGLPLSIRVVPAAARVLTPPAPEGLAYHPPVRFYHLRQWLNR
jgi:diacylglycerol kinase (ATP)